MGARFDAAVRSLFWWPAPISTLSCAVAVVLDLPPWWPECAYYWTGGGLVLTLCALIMPVLFDYEKMQ